MAGVIPGFPAGEFRAGIRLAMSLGLPPVESDRPLFVFAPVITNDTPADEDGLPFDWSATPTVAAGASLRVLCAVEFDDTTGRVENMGVIVPSAVTITLLDEEYQQVKGFHYVQIGTDRYYYRTTQPPLGLDVVGVWSVTCVSEDDS